MPNIQQKITALQQKKEIGFGYQKAKDHLEAIIFNQNRTKKLKNVKDF